MDAEPERWQSLLRRWRFCLARECAPQSPHHTSCFPSCYQCGSRPGAGPAHRAFDQLGILLQQRNELPELLLGQEIWAPDAASVRRVTGRRDVGLPGRFLLVEFGFDLRGDHNEVVREVLDAGRQILIAHPERYHYLPGAEPIEVMRYWQDLGALLQVNVGSLSGHYEGSSPGSERLAWQLIDSGMVDVVATDHHGPRRRGVSPAEGLQVLMNRGASAVAQRVMEKTPPGLCAMICCLQVSRGRVEVPIAWSRSPVGPEEVAPPAAIAALIWSLILRRKAP